MKRIAYLASLLFASSLIAQDIRTLRDGYKMGDAFMDHEGTLLLAETDREGFSSILHLQREAQPEEVWPIADLRINVVRWIDGSSPKIILGGSNGTSVSRRVYRVEEGSELVEEWDSIHLAQELQEAEITLSNDGRLWSASFFGSQKARIVVGATADPTYGASWEWDLEVPWVKGADDMNSSSLILDSDPENPLVAVVYKGSIFVFSKVEPVITQLLPAADLQVHGLYYQEEAGLLWGVGPNSHLSGFRLANLQQRKGEGAPLVAAYEVDPRELGLPPTIVDMSSFADGDLVLYATTQDASFLYRLEIDPDRGPRARSALRIEKRSRLAGAGVVEPFFRHPLRGSAGPSSYRAQRLDSASMFQMSSEAGPDPAFEQVHHEEPTGEALHDSER